MTIDLTGFIGHEMKLLDPKSRARLGFPALTPATGKPRNRRRLWTRAVSEETERANTRKAAFRDLFDRGLPAADRAAGFAAARARRAQEPM